jgi:acyl carrier protein
MTDSGSVRAIVLDALQSLSRQRPDGNRFAVSDDTVVYGAGGVLDSLDLVNLVIELEQRVEERFGAAVTLADERAVSQRHSPFRSVPSLVTLIMARLTDDAASRG